VHRLRSEPAGAVRYANRHDRAAYDPNPSAFAVALFSAPATAPWMPFDPQNNAVSYLKFVTILAPDNGQGWWWFFGQTPTDVGNLLTQNNAMPTQLAPYWDTDGSFKLSVLMQPDNGRGWWWFWGQTPADVSNLLSQNNAMPVQLTPYWDSDGSFKFVVIMAPDNGQGWWWFWGQTPAEVGNLLSQNNAMPVQLTPYWDSDGSFKLVVIMTPDNGQPWWWFWGLDIDSTFQEINAAGNQIPVQTLSYLGC